MNLRVLAILLVVIGHSLILYSSEWNLYTPPRAYPPFDVTKTVINTIQMPLFFSISGYLFPHTLAHSDLSFAHFVKGKALRLLVPFLFIAYCWLLPIRLLVRYPAYQGKGIVSILVQGIFWGNDVGHLWFLPALFLIFLVMWPICRIAVGKIGYIPLFCVLAIFSIGSGLIRINTYLVGAFANAVWFFLGYLIRNRRTSGKPISATYKVSLIVITVLAQILNIWIHTNPVKVPHGVILTGFVASLLSVAAFYAVVPQRPMLGVKYFDSRSFGIYLFHSPLVYVTYTYLADLFPWAVFAINFFIMGGIALAVTNLIRATPLRVLIGEKAKTKNSRIDDSNPIISTR